MSAKRCRMTQSTCAGGLGGMTVCCRKPGKPATVRLVASCHAANAFSALARTRVCVTIVTPLPAEASTSLMVVPSWSFGELVEDAVGREWQVGEAHAGRIHQ